MSTITLIEAYQSDRQLVYPNADGGAWAGQRSVPVSLKV